MAVKVKLNKNSLREQNQSLRLFQEFLPTLELRKQQLQVELRKAQHRIVACRTKLEMLLQQARPIAAMLQSTLDEVKPLVSMQRVVTKRGNIAGVRVQLFDKVEFSHVPYGLMGTAPFVDTAVSFWQHALSAKAEIDVLQEQARALEDQLVKTSQRINLYEKVLIPECLEAIRRIKVYLGDQQTAAVCRAKIAKNKLLRGDLAQAEGQGA